VEHRRTSFGKCSHMSCASKVSSINSRMWIVCENRSFLNLPLTNIKRYFVVYDTSVFKLIIQRTLYCICQVAPLCTLFNTWFPGPTRLSIPNYILITTAVFAQLTAESPYTLHWPPLFPSKLPLRMRDLDPI